MGLQLTGLGAEDLVDVIHYFFEIDNFYASSEEAESRGKVRSSIYRNFYNRSYKYGYTSSDNRYNYSTASGASNTNYAGTNVDDPLNERPPTKPFVPSTNFDPDSPVPFGSALGPPAG
jgi:hypothetical protein